MTIVDIVPDSERRGFIGATAAAAATLRVADAARPADRHLAALLAMRLERRACRRRRALGPVPLAVPRRLRDAQRGLRLQRHRRPRSRPAGRANPAAPARQPARVGAVCVGPDRSALPDRPRRPGSAQRDRRDHRPGQHRARRRLPVHEAHHLVAAGLARSRLFVGRSGRLAGRSRVARLARLASLVRKHRLGDRLRHALRDPGHRGRCAWSG